MKRLMMGFLLCFWAIVAWADLTPAQKTTLLAAIQADPQIKSIYDTGNDFLTAQALNVMAAPAFPLWNNRTNVQAIIDGMQLDKFTAVDPPDGSVLTTNRLLSVQVKQMNLQLMLTGRASIDAGLDTVRGNVRDAVIQVPAGAGGTMVTVGGASGVTTLTAMTRSALLIEKILAGAQKTTGTVTANVIGWDGPISTGDIASLR